MPATTPSVLRATRARLRAAVATTLLCLVTVPVVGALNPTPASAAAYGQLVVNNAATHYGQPYTWGATGPSTFDCSGFTGFIYRQFGVALPRTASDQYNAVAHVAQSQREPGDLIFTYDSGGIYHVGIYAGNDSVWAATHTGDVVRPQAMWTSSYYVGRPVLGGAIGAKWESLGGARSGLGQALNLEHPVPGAQKVDFQYGDIYWSPSTGAHEVHGAIAGEYDAVGASGSALGIPRDDEVAVAGGRGSRFTGGAIYWSPATNAHEVHGGISQKYDALGGPAFGIGLPTSDEGDVPGGRASSFAVGVIYWGPATGAVEVHGAILGRYTALGGPGGQLGLPAGDERAAPGGRETPFQHGTLRWNATTGVVTLLPTT